MTLSTRQRVLLDSRVLFFVFDMMWKVITQLDLFSSNEIMWQSNDLKEHLDTPLPRRCKLKAVGTAITTAMNGEKLMHFWSD